MPRKITANLRANLIFYRRNKLLWLIAFVFIVVGGLSILPALFFSTSQGRFMTVAYSLRTLLLFINFYVLAMGVLNVWYQRRNRCYKMVVTKPCRPETWLLSNFLSAMLVAVGLYALLIGMAFCVLAIFGIPVQWGLFSLILVQLAGLMVEFSFLIFLCMVVHPFVAVVLFLIFNEWTFYQLSILTSAGYRDAGSGLAKAGYGFLKVLFVGLYFVYPSTNLFKERTQELWMNMRLESGDVTNTLMMFLYGVLISVLFFILASFVLRRRRAS